MSNVETKVKSAVVQLLLDHPFFGSVVMKRPIKFEDVGTACVDMNGAIRIDPAFAESLSGQELQFVIAHEAMHVVYAHLPRLQGRNAQAWNVATDAVINDMLERERVGSPLRNAVRMQGAADKTADEIYADIMRNQPPEPQSGLGGQGNGGGQWEGEAMPDLREEDLTSGTQMSEADIARKVAEGKMEIAEAAQGARMQGKLSGGLASTLEDYLKSKVPWYQVLERFMVGKAEQHRTWNRPNKRFLSTAYLPRRERVPSMGKLVIGIDVSASVSDEEVRGFLGHVNAIIEQAHPEQVVVLYTTESVEHVDTFTPDMYPVTATQKRWWGGTDMGAVTQWIKDSGEEADLCVIFTDGYTPAPKVVPCDIVWAVTTNTDCSNLPGEILRVADGN